MEHYMLGCNYWSSHAGTNMWKCWDEEIVKNDLELLKENGIECMRVFPTWPDFQPVTPVYGHASSFRYYCDEDEERYWDGDYISEVMIERFLRFCDLCREGGIKLIVGVLTGWMSGRTLVPPALYNKNLYEDPEALWLEQKYVRGIVSRLRHHDAIYAWDLGNECNCLVHTQSRFTAANWTALISNAIRAADPTRPVISGMHSLTVEDVWRISDQADYTDILTTHPYPQFVPHCSTDRISSIRTLLHATCETLFYADIGGKPCMVEEIGTLGPTQGSEEEAADFYRVNLYSNWAHGATGLLWWCGFDFNSLAHPPYSWNMCERELGMITENKKPKKFLLELNAFHKQSKSLPTELSPFVRDGVCLVTECQDQWAAGYISYILGIQAGIQLGFSAYNTPLPDSDLYLMPSIAHGRPMDKRLYTELKQKVADGAVLYISNDNGFLTEFEELTGNRIEASETVVGTPEYMILQGDKIPISRKRRLVLSARSSEVLAADQDEIPCFTRHSYGKGMVYFMNAPLETGNADTPNAFNGNLHKVYEIISENRRKTQPLSCDNRDVGITLHPFEDGYYAVAVNYGSEDQQLQLHLSDSYRIAEVLRGSTERIAACDAMICKLVKKV